MPRTKCRVASGTVFVGGQTVTTELKVIVDPAVGGQKALCMAG